MLNAITTELIRATFAIATPVLAYYAVLLVHRLAAKAGLAVTEAQDARIQFFTKQAVQKAQEIVEAKRPDTGAGALKLQIATQDLLAKMPDLLVSEAQSLIHAKLPELGFGASASAPMLTAELVTGGVVPLAPAAAGK